MINKNRLIIVITISTIIILSGITIGTRMSSMGKKMSDKNQKGLLIVGMPEDKQAGLIKEMGKAARQYRYIENGNALLEEGRINEAISVYETALAEARSQGAKGEAIYYLSNAYEKKKDYNNALEYAVIDRDKFVSDWAKEPVAERVQYLEYALQGEYDLAVEHAQKALEADANLPNTPKGGSPEYIQRLNDLKAAKDYILSLKKK